MGDGTTNDVDERAAADDTRSVPATQHQLFDTEPEPWEADDQSQRLVASVVLSAGPAQSSTIWCPMCFARQ